ncbi:MAG: hypothetical protein ACETWR_18130 [Anaerolineae bacterium]
MTESLVRSGSLSALVFEADAPDFLWSDPEATSRLAAFLDLLPPWPAHVSLSSSCTNCPPAGASISWGRDWFQPP